MTYQAERKLINEFFVAQWGAGSNTPIKRENSDWEEEPVKALDLWVSLTIINDVSGQIDLGSGLKLMRYPGLAIVQVFTKARTGAGLARTAAEEVSSIFRGQTLQSDDALVRFIKPPYVNVAGESDGWYQLNVNAPFKRDSVQTIP